jgi:hypothetical protein
VKSPAKSKTARLVKQDLYRFCATGHAGASKLTRF